MIRFACPTCSTEFTVQDALAGKVGRCPRCQTRITIPQPPEPEPVEEILELVPEPPPPRRSRPDDEDGDDDLDRPRRRQPRSERVSAGVLAICLGFVGAHKFYLGYPAAGVTMILLTLCTCFGGVLGIVEGIIYLSKTDREFVETYQVNQRPWF